jgi:hypothetical protein
MDPQTPDVYCDSAQISLSPFDVLLLLFERPPAISSTMPPKTVACVRMSLEHAKVFAMMLRKALKQYEENLGSPIPLSPQVYPQLGLSPHEDW